MAEGLTLVCPVRGRLKVTGRTADGMTASEERYRVEAIKYLVDRGYPKENFVVEPVIKRFGNSGRNSFRADFAVLDVPAAEVSRNAEDVLEHALLLGEVKRDNADAEDAKEYQVKPLLDFAGNMTCLAVYWDNVERRVFWRKQVGKKLVVEDGPIESLPTFGGQPDLKALLLDDLRSESSLKSIFERIEDVLHSASIGPQKRFEMMLQLLLSKIHDEHEHEVTPKKPLTVQDYRSLGISATAAKKTFGGLLAAAVQYYQRHLPEPVAKTMKLPDETFLEVMALLAPHRITAMRHSVIQEFYMYFAKGLYKWDLAQYFTPPTVTDFIIDVINPQWSELVRDPACGSADFLTAAFRRGQHYRDYASRISGADVSKEAAQVAVLNMVLNGDGKTNISVENSLVTVDKRAGEWDVLVCNPPFGVKIKERAEKILQKFDLGRVQELDDDGDGEWRPTDKTLDSQETGILFAELCLRLARPGTGRVALVVPNGYLGNKSARYVQLRQHILRNGRVAAIVALPRFTFKGSGADVSASVLFVERREEPLASVFDADEYDIAVQVIDRVGWSTGDKRAAPTFRRDESDGTFVLDEESEMIIDSDFGEVLAGIRTSDASEDFPWLVAGVEGADNDSSWSVSSRRVFEDPNFTMDAKRLSKKYLDVVESIKSVEHLRLGDLVEFVPEGRDASGEQLKRHADRDYQYIELQNVEAGSYRSESLKGWQLPARAKHGAARGDFFVGAVWSSVRKWLLIGGDEEDLLVTNGMHRLRLRPEHADRAVDLVAAFSTEAYRVQMRALSRGSDGLAEVGAADVADVLVPLITDAKVRREIEPFVKQMLGGFMSVERKVAALAASGKLPMKDVPRRASHVMIV